MNDERDPLFAFSIIGRYRKREKWDAATDSMIDATPVGVKHRVDFIRAAGEISARSLAIEEFEREFPELEVASILVDSVEGH